MLYWIVHAISAMFFRVLFALLGGFRVEGLENVPRKGAVIIAPNHLSHLDPPVIGVAVPRRAWFMATDELFGIRGLRTFARILRAFPVRQDSPDRAALRKAEGFLKAGDALVVFPEGHESVTGELQPILPGIIMLAARSGAPVVPVGIVGTDAMMPATTFKPRRCGRPIRVRFGRPIAADELTGGLRGREGLDRGAARLREAIEALLAELPPERYVVSKRPDPVAAAGNGGLGGYSRKE